MCMCLGAHKYGVNISIYVSQCLPDNRSDSWNSICVKSSVIVPETIWHSNKYACMYVLGCAVVLQPILTSIKWNLNSNSMMSKGNDSCTNPSEKRQAWNKSLHLWLCENVYNCAHVIYIHTTICIALGISNIFCIHTQIPYNNCIYIWYGAYIISWLCYGPTVKASTQFANGNIYICMYVFTTRIWAGPITCAYAWFIPMKARKRPVCVYCFLARYNIKDVNIYKNFNWVDWWNDTKTHGIYAVEYWLECEVGVGAYKFFPWISLEFPL